MIEVSFFKARKPSGKLGLIALIYILTVVSLFILLRPRMLELRRIESSILHEQSQVQMIERLIEQRRAIENDAKALTAANHAFEQTIPQALNLPEVLLAVKDLAAAFEVELMRLDYEPLRTQGVSSWYRLNLEAAGPCGSIAAIIEILAVIFPTSRFHNLSMISTLNETVYLKTDLDLYVIPSQWETSVSWQRPVWETMDPKACNPFGIPLWYLQELCIKGIKLIGVVRVRDGEHRALVSFNGAQEWKRIGDPLGTGTVADIKETELILDVHGVKLCIDFGGELK
ncbi:MAG TPA: hypothetical protein GX739_03690 [Firmicutes bacterium]|nr:hypothetical protein [Bacillota bacterium]